MHQRTKWILVILAALALVWVPVASLLQHEQYPVQQIFASVGTYIFVAFMGLILFGLARLIYAAWHFDEATSQPPAGYCRTCGYNLTGNLSGICPECGTAIPKEREREGGKQALGTIDYATPIPKRPRKPLPRLLVAHLVASYLMLLVLVLLGLASGQFDASLISADAIAVLLFAPIILPFMLLWGLLAYFYRLNDAPIWGLILCWAGYLASLALCYRLYSSWHQRRMREIADSAARKRGPERADYETMSR